MGALTKPQRLTKSMGLMSSGTIKKENAENG